MMMTNSLACDRMTQSSLTYYFSVYFTDEKEFQGEVDPREREVCDLTYVEMNKNR
jgi:hypothetical protein